PGRRFSAYRLRLLCRFRSGRCLLHRLRRSHHENRRGQNCRRLSPPPSPTQRIPIAIRQPRSPCRRRSPLSPDQTNPPPAPPRPLRHAGPRLLHASHEPQLRPPQQLFPHLRLSALEVLSSSLPVLFPILFQSHPGIAFRSILLTTCTLLPTSHSSDFHDSQS